MTATDAKAEPLSEACKHEWSEDAREVQCLKCTRNVWGALSDLRARLREAEAQLEAAAIRADLDVRVLELQAQRDATRAQLEEAKRESAVWQMERHEAVEWQKAKQEWIDVAARTLEGLAAKCDAEKARADAAERERDEAIRARKDLEWKLGTTSLELQTATMSRDAAERRAEAMRSALTVLRDDVARFLGWAVMGARWAATTAEIASLRADITKADEALSSRDEQGGNDG